MKRTTLFVLGAGLMAGLAFWMTHGKSGPVTQQQATVEAAAPQEVEPAGPQPMKHNQAADRVPDANTPEDPSFSKPQPAAAPVVAPDPQAAARMAFQQSMDILLSSQSTHEQRQAAWKQLMKAGQLDQAISQLQQLMTANPQSAQYPGDLGEAYLKKCSQTDDVREQGILALNADELFDTALNLDPSDWEARYTKAVALSHWPPSLNKGQDAINNLLTLIQQQEAQPPQSQFALPYLQLGDQYQKTGSPDSARQVWAVGAGLFPGNEDLQSRLASAK
jgi:tetratricopeptide (TPR) repeat protein